MRHLAPGGSAMLLYWEGLVHTHTNLKLEQRLEMYETGLFPWDIEMTVEEPVSDDDDGPPQKKDWCNKNDRGWNTPEI